jgi:hypothetical protein
MESEDSMQDSFRRSTITLPTPGTVVAANGVASYTAPRPMRIAGAQLCLSDSGAGAGATKAVINVNGVAITAANDLSIAGAAGNKTVSVAVTKGSNQYPGGARLNNGDVVTVDITAVPGTTVPKLAFVVLDIVEVDV